jgi:hypothetical protein
MKLLPLCSVQLNFPSREPGYIKGEILSKVALNDHYVLVYVYEEFPI